MQFLTHRPRIYHTTKQSCIKKENWAEKIIVFSHFHIKLQNCSYYMANELA